MKIASGIETVSSHIVTPKETMSRKTSNRQPGNAEVPVYDYTDTIGSFSKNGGIQQENQEPNILNRSKDKVTFTKHIENNLKFKTVGNRSRDSRTS